MPDVLVSSGARVWRHWLAAVALLLLAACAEGPTTAGNDTADRIARLRSDILALGPGVDAEEAARAARIAIEYPLKLRQDYQVSDPAIVHNMKVNSGLRPRGLCYQWADDLQARLAKEEFETLDMHRAIANARKVFRIDHSTVVLSASGAAWDRGIVLDPWRFGGTLYWGPPLEDQSYAWEPRQQVLAFKRARFGDRDRD
ncbi:hypothetical protein [Aestuariicoccus sp. MJ-SS9]|uniref:hypothetical protein n=1 Tax=Aestuariicoccus sp. MJ-SS9 TaxID=3079855 RepID=UPI00290DA87D|nr:hypothetical protein [Aestuariicoccus sp. MJ-SS9]MDU8912909.1 hypothetical protein [Aestuariicoccus sp. MJ-SS9]